MDRRIIKERNVSVDVLRILLALMVVTIHIGAPLTGHVLNSVSWTPTKLFAYIVHYASIPAVNVYILISGYFSYSQNHDYKRLFKKAVSLWLVLLFYSLAGLLTTFLISNREICIKDVVDHIFFLSTGEWWFMTNYFCLLFLSPFLNIIVSAFSKLEFKFFAVAIAVMFGILPSLCGWHDAIGLNYGYSLIWFIVLYILGSGIKRFNLDKKYNYSCISYLMCYMFMTIVILGQNFLFGKVFHMSEMAFSHYNSVTILVQAIFLFLTFLKLKLSCRFNRIIILVSSLSMSVYILHCQTDFSKILWNFTNPSSFANDGRLPLLYIIITLGVFILACSIEYLRKMLFSTLRIDRLIDRLSAFINLD